LAWQLLRGDLAPFAEANEDVLPDRNVALKEIGHRRRGNPQRFLGHRLDQFVSGGDCGRVLAEKHGTVGGEVIVVHPVARIKVHRPGAVVELTVRDDSLLIPVHCVAVVATLHIYVRRHVHQVAHIGGELTQAVAGYQRRFGMRGHFHQMDVEVQKPGMVHRPRQIAEGGFEHLARLERTGTGRGLAGAQIPHAPRRTIENRFDEDEA